MKKKILALTLILPLIFMLALFSVGKIASIIVNIPVSGISITTQNKDGFIEIDASGYKQDLYLDAKIEPLNASNKGFSYSVSGVGGAEPADISVGRDGRVTANGLGSAKVTVTSAENGYTDSVIIYVYSSKVLSLLPKISDLTGNALEVGSTGGRYKAEIESGIYNFSAAAYPSNLSSDISFTSENPDILEINSVTGRAKAKLSGITTVKITCSGKGETASSEIEVTVNRRTTESGITVNGLDSPTINCAGSASTVEFLIDKTPAYNALSSAETEYVSISGSGAYYIAQKTEISVKEHQFKIVLELKDGHPDELKLKVSAGGSGESSVKLKFADYNFDVYTSYHLSGDNTIYQILGKSVTYIADGEPYDPSVTYEWSAAGDRINITPTQNGETCQVDSLAQGKSAITVTAYKNGAAVEQITKTVNIVKALSSVDFTDNAKTYGIEDMLTVGDSVIKNGRKTYELASLPLVVRADGEEYEGSYSEDFIFESSDENVLSANVTRDKLYITVNGSGVATLTVKWKYADRLGVDVKASVTLRAVKDGVRVSDYQDLMRASENGYKIVLDSDVMLGRKGAGAEELKTFAKTLPTDYDWKFYQNQGLARPEIKYLVEFKNDVYGNGHTINGDYITKAADSAGNPLLFGGPLDFVSIATAAVKAQDNIVFLVRTNGVTLDNVVLKGCSDESITTQEGMDLSKLNYTGTTLEIAADCNLLNSRVSNGRTAVRIFGGKTTNGTPVVNSTAEVDAAAERIKVRIESCVLTNAREFILKIGTNRAVRAQTVNGASVPVRFSKLNGAAYNCFDPSNAQDDYFYDNYVLTDVTLKNSVLATSGLFSIGMETHFAGEMLAGTVTGIQPAGWKDLACTSYASALKFEGDVKLLDWKNLKNVDSSTLIEATGAIKSFLKLDINTMLSKVNALHDDYKHIISDINGERYVHGGIACYGGGYNYSFIDMSECTSEALKRFVVNLSILAEGEPENSDLYLQGTMLPLAAGRGDFAFYMYDAESENDYFSQQKLQQEGVSVPPARF